MVTVLFINLLAHIDKVEEGFVWYFTALAKATAVK